MEKPTVELFCGVYDTLYSSAPGVSSEQKSQANQWLTQLSKSVFAWEMADQLLLLKRDEGTSMYAALMMSNKIKDAFYELPADTHTGLRDSLVNHLTQLAEASPKIVRQLAMALADLTLLMGSWSSVVDDMIAHFSTSPALVSALLDVLIILPEEINSRDLRLGENKRKQFKALLTESSGKVLSLLRAVSTQLPDNTAITVRLFACFGSWVQLCGFSAEEILECGLLAPLFATLSSLESPDKLFAAATDSLCSLLYICEDVDKYGQLTLYLKSTTKTLLPVFHEATKLENPDRVTSLCRIFTELCESLLMYLVTDPGSQLGDLGMLDLLLDCADHHDYEVVDITFNVWFRLSEEILSLKEDELIATFAPYIHRLILKLAQHCQLEPDTDPSTVPDDQDDFMLFRANVAELIRDLIFITGSVATFSQLYEEMMKPGAAWNTYEASLFIMYSIAPSIRHDEGRVLPGALPALLCVEVLSYCSVRSTTLRLVSQLAPWINHHPENLQAVLAFIYTSIQIRPVAMTAATAIKNVCSYCRGHMGPFFTQLVEIIAAAETLGLTDKSITNLLRGATEVLSSLDRSSVSQGMTQLVTLVCEPLARPGADVCSVMDRLTAVFRGCSVRSRGEEHPAGPAIQVVWPLVKQIFTAYNSNEAVIERTARCVRYILRCSSTAAAPIVSDLIVMSLELLRAGHSCFLYLGSIVVDEYGKDPTYRDLLHSMLGCYSEVSLATLSTGPDQHPETVDDLFRLIYRFVQRCPDLFVSSPLASVIVECGLNCLSMAHLEALASVAKFFRDLLHLPLSELSHVSPEKQQACQLFVQSVVEQHTQRLVGSLMSMLIHLRGRMSIESAEVIWELSRLFKSNQEYLVACVKDSLSSLPDTSRLSISQEQINTFAINVTTCGNLEELQTIVKSFTRLYK